MLGFAIIGQLLNAPVWREGSVLLSHLQSVTLMATGVSRLVLKITVSRQATLSRLLDQYTLKHMFD